MWYDTSKWVGTNAPNFGSTACRFCCAPRLCVRPRQGPARLRTDPDSAFCSSPTNRSTPAASPSTCPSRSPTPAPRRSRSNSRAPNASTWRSRTRLAGMSGASRPVACSRRYSARKCFTPPTARAWPTRRFFPGCWVLAPTAYGPGLRTGAEISLPRSASRYNERHYRLGRAPSPL